FPKEKWQKRKRPHGWIPRQIFNLFAKKYRLPRGGPVFFYAHKSQFLAWYSASAGIVLALKNKSAPWRSTFPCLPAGR
ncbi:MAG: hypothetical protein WC120_04900, partial [Parcubacteria group bacterium]